MSEDCIFCQIVSGDRLSDIVFRNDSVVAFKDIKPHAPVHLLIVPVKHIRSINELTEDDGTIVSEMVMAARQLAKTMGIAHSGYKLAFNVERGGGQYVFHLHLHLLGGW